MNSSSNLMLIVFLLVFSSLSFAYAAWFMNSRISGKRNTLKRLLGEDEETFKKEPSKKLKIRIDLMKITPKSYLSSLRNKLSKSGQVGDEFLTKMIRSKFIFSAAGFALGAIYFLPSGGSFRAILAGILGFFIPDILLTNRIQKRAESIQEALPDSVEMLTMCVEAGLSFQQSLQRVSENQKNVISTEFARVMSEIQIGEPRVAALANMGNRLNHPDVSKFVTAMLQVDRLGIPISSVLNEQVDELRSRARMRAREKAQKVPVKILGPVMACFMPCTLIIVLGPVILQFVS